MAREKEKIGAIALTAIAAGKDNDAVLRLVKRVHPKCRTTAASINWYRSQFKKRKKTTKRRKTGRA